MLVKGFNSANVKRIYLGQPALIDGKLPENMLSKPCLRTATAYADGLTDGEVAEAMRTDGKTIRERMLVVRRELGVVALPQLAGFFPMEPGYGAIGDKKLSDLQKVPCALSILEALSVGKYHWQLAAEKDITQQAAKNYEGETGRVWDDIEGGLMATRVANALRSHLLEAAGVGPEDIDLNGAAMYTLSNLALLEPHMQVPASVEM